MVFYEATLLKATANKEKIPIEDIMENLINLISTAEVFKSPLLPVCTRSHEV